MSSPIIQSQNVCSIIGNKGEDLSGQYVKSIENSSAKTIKAEFDFEFVPAESIAEPVENIIQEPSIEDSQDGD